MTSVSSSTVSSSGETTSRTTLPGFDWVLLVAVVGIIAASVRAIAFTPMEVLQGMAQKTLYIHVPAAIISLYMAVVPTAIVSALYLWLKDDRLDRIAESLAEIGLLFLSVVLCTGPLWAKPIWGTWWVWDARLTSTLFLWFVLVGYLVLRGAVDQREERARLSAVVASLAGLLVPFIHLTVYLFNTLHPQPLLLKPDITNPSMSPEMTRSFLWSLTAFSLFYVALVRSRYQWASVRDAMQLRDDQ